MMGKFAKAALLAVSAMALTGANQNWNAAVERTAISHTIGNPDADVTLVEFVSYTCPHCATFSHEGDAALKLAYIAPGTVRVEIRHIVRDPLDFTAAMMTNCGEPGKFAANHTAMMLAQPKWLEVNAKATAGQKARWNGTDWRARTRAIASDHGFYDIMERRGYGRSELDRCLGDETMAQRLVDATRASYEEYQVKGTPSFAVNGALLDRVHDWASLQPELDAGVKAARAATTTGFGG